MKAKCYIPRLGSNAGYVSRHIVGGVPGIIREYLRKRRPYERIELSAADAGKADALRAELKRQAPDMVCGAELALVEVLRA